MFCQQRVLILECNKVNVIKELFNVKFNFATVSVLDLADTVFSIQSLLLNSHFNLCFSFYIG